MLPELLLSVFLSEHCLQHEAQELDGHGYLFVLQGPPTLRQWEMMEAVRGVWAVGLSGSSREENVPSE